VVDLRELTFLDSAGVHTLVSVRRSAERRDGALSLIRGPRSVQPRGERKQRVGPGELEDRLHG
jgi:anti-anti-sigma regulatory factor